MRRRDFISLIGGAAVTWLLAGLGHPVVVESSGGAGGSMSRALLLAAATVAVLLAPPAAAQLVNENLLVKMPAGYKVGYHAENDKQMITEMVPSGETVDDWTEMVTVQIFRGRKLAPEQFRDSLMKGWNEGCPNASSKPTTSATENGYPSVLWLLNCPRNPKTGKPEITWFKAIRGNDSFYVVQKAFKFTPSKEQVAQWLGYLKSVSVCDTRLSDRRCPVAEKK